MASERNSSVRRNVAEEAVKYGVQAVLLHHQEEPMRGLDESLAELGVRGLRAQNCAQAAELLAHASTPILLFCDTILPDGTWADALNIAARAAVPVNVIVVARFVNIRFYVEVIERGAFDFITPPFVTSDLSHVVRCASVNLVDRRVAQARPA